ncbi:NADPH-dependent FMN reductase [Colwellia ponticola]|uniref:NAD(P)H-dependent oxidoreductase n=1 Tax=Colwellia ponticola TaxID=2304625 RepID=A0A8H2JK80_9GAMM|nr:NADPH-dependent FMN reductase [Colwellia ponticola]TMM42536.1 NAD(P)H-dependent oxidoreductase [Colwellia ponticola]
MKLLAFAASSSSTSINKKLVTYAASLVANATVEIIDINDYEMPLFSEDKEALGLPAAAQAFYQKLGQADAIVISFAEHNGSYTAAYKNLFDWTTRIDMKIFQHKPVVFLATSPGPGGAQSVLSSAVNSAHFFAADVKASVSVPSFFDNYDGEKQQITNPAIVSELSSALGKLNN